ncbi:MAG: UDP-2,3-diacylglucosamine diphosphatase [Rhodocyclaceae bacterium]|nr:UDP-2,3-diacylglucosamine diphosphatase [Rhodocyclaceae bacterium]
MVFDGIPQSATAQRPHLTAPPSGNLPFGSPPPSTEQEAGGDNAATLHFRTIWISDIHLGTSGCQAELLLEFLKHTESKQLYLVGDIIDGWQLARRWYWHRLHNDVVQKILRKARKGTRVTYVAGNHDEFARHFLGLAFGDIEIVDEAVHTTATGKRLLILHGDQFDAVVQCAKWLAHLGDMLYGISLELNRRLNRVRRALGLPYWSLSQYLKHRVKNAVSYINAFEEAVAREAKRRQLDGVVCGHIHHPEIRDIDGITYCNDGDWVESLSALVETADGELRLISWLDIEAWRNAKAVEQSALTIGGTQLPLPLLSKQAT